MVTCGALIRPVAVRGGQVDHFGALQTIRYAFELAPDALQGHQGARHLAQRPEHHREAGRKASEHREERTDQGVAHALIRAYVISSGPYVPPFANILIRAFELFPRSARPPPLAPMTGE